MIWCLWQSHLVICLETVHPTRHAELKVWALSNIQSVLCKLANCTLHLNMLPKRKACCQSCICLYHAMQASLSCKYYTSDIGENAACVSPEQCFPWTVLRHLWEPAGVPAANKNSRKEKEKKRKEKTRLFGVHLIRSQGLYRAAQARTTTPWYCKWSP